MNDEWVIGLFQLQTIVQRAFNKGYWIIVEDEEADYRISRHKAGIVRDASATEYANLHIYRDNEAKDKVGWLLIIPSNGEDAVSDMSDNEAMWELTAGLDQSNAGMQPLD